MHVIEAAVNGVAANAAVSSERQIPHLQVVGGHAVHDAVNRLFTRILSRPAVSHQFHHEKGAHGLHHRFSKSGGGGAAHFRVHKQPCTEDGAVADATVHFVGQTTCGAASRESSFVVQRENADGVVVLDVDHGIVV